MLKMVEDGLVHAGVLPDDTPQYVASITVTSVKDKADEVDVTITPYAP
jgi:Holliday junction resolvase RusA-like endonuclease